MRTILLMIIVAVFSLNISAQEIPEEENKSQNTEIIEEHFPTGAELVAHRRIVDSFVTSLLNSLDVAESLKEFGVDDWRRRSTAEMFTSEEIFDSETKSEVMNSPELMEFYVLMINHVLIGSLHHSLLPEGHTQEQCAPLAVQRIFRQNSFLRLFIGESGEDDPKISSVEKLKEMAGLFQYAGRIYRRELRAKIQINHEQYEKRLAQIKHESNENVPTIEILSEPKFGMPKGSRILNSTYYIFQLRIALVNNQYKVVALECNFGD